MDDTELGEETKRKIAMEKARQEHLKSMQEQSSSKLRSNNIGASSGAVSGVFLEDAGDGHIVNLAREEDEEPVRIPSSISAKLKPHQVCCTALVMVKNWGPFKDLSVRASDQDWKTVVKSSRAGPIPGH